jgi:hypothetical protein
VAGAEDEIFEPEAIDLIHTISSGFPRVINIICDQALRLGCQEDQEVISAAIVNQCSKTLHVAHRLQSHQYGNHFGSANEWLEESEVPSLSPEAIDRVSQPLPDFIVDNEAEIEEESRPYSAKVPLFLAVLLISVFFLFKYGNLASLSNFITILNKNAIVATDINATSNTDSQKIIEVVQVVDQSVTSEPTATENFNMTKVLADDVQEEENVESEVISEPPIPPASVTPAIVEKAIEKEKQSTPQSKVESVPKDIDSTVVQNRVTPEPQTPTRPTSTAKETSDTNDDPGAVIDWLLKSKQN